MILFLEAMIHSTAQKRWGEVASCAYRVGVELSEAHCAGFNEDVRDCSVPSSAGYMILVGEGRCCGVGGWMCVWKRRLRCEKRGIIKSAQLRGGDGERTNSAAIQSVLALVPEYLHSHSLSRSGSRPPPPPGSPEISKGLAETSNLLRLTATATPAKGARITWPVFRDHHPLPWSPH
jgi:hypothetical protein